METYADYQAYWKMNDIKAESYIKGLKPIVIKSFYQNLTQTNGKLSTQITCTSNYPNGDPWLYRTHLPIVDTMCKEVESFVQSKGFPYKLYESDITHDGVCICRFKIH